MTDVTLRNFMDFLPEIRESYGNLEGPSWIRQSSFRNLPLLGDGQGIRKQKDELGGPL